MTDEKEFTFTESGVGALPNLGANATNDKGENLFPQLGKKHTLLVTGWEMGFPDEKTGKLKPVIQLKMDNGDLYQRVVGANMQKKVARLKFSKPDELIGKYITFEKYDTKSSNPQFRWGLRIVSISEKKTLE